MKKILLVTAILAIMGAGCSVKSNGLPSLSAAIKEYKVEIIKSPVLKNTLTLSAKSPTNVKELMYQSGEKFESRMNISNTEVVTKLDGVISTASKNWNLYLNDKKIEFTNLNKIEVKASDKIEWKYEAN